MLKNQFFELLEKEYGTAALIAAQLDITQEAVSGWKARNQVPSGRVPAVAKITGLSFHQIRPDLFAA